MNWSNWKEIRELPMQAWSSSKDIMDWNFPEANFWVIINKVTGEMKKMTGEHSISNREDSKEKLQAQYKLYKDKPSYNLEEVKLLVENLLSISDGTLEKDRNEWFYYMACILIQKYDIVLEAFTRNTTYDRKKWKNITRITRI